MTICKNPEKVIDINDRWKTKGRQQRNDSSSFERIFVPGNPTREKSDGDVTQINVERALKLRVEETKGKQFNIINGLSETQWIHAFGKQ